ncbi:Extracellular sulfatase Sulf-2 [Channa argus]|uniref:Extracellular sulfatase Sulf-2 n=1 Tax=Channa argus TaxID=215402 RepID=A0A6G1Q282_CHAAH|nr:Extracellular sulfatase Sulf-2 [Channa argus]
MAGQLLLFLFVTGTLGHAHFQSGQRLKPRLQRDRRNIRPNIILVLTDDQDLELGSMQAMNKTRRIMEEGGTSFSNAFVTTPMCCPSRSSMLTGKYVHNHNTYTNNENCSSLSWQRQHEPRTFGVYLNNTGYRTEWLGLVKNSRFYNYTLSRNGVREKHGAQYPQIYSKQSMIKPKKKSISGVQLIRTCDVIKTHGDQATMGILPLKYQTQELRCCNWEHEVKTLRFDQIIFEQITNSCAVCETLKLQLYIFFASLNTPSYNYAPNTDKHWIMRYTGPMKPIHMEFTNMLQRKRLQTLLSVDDSMEKLYNMLVETGELENTYIIYTSDHGYHIGQFGLVKGKSMPYEFDIRVPFYIRGPNVEQGGIIKGRCPASDPLHISVYVCVFISNPHMVLNIDLAPTILDIAGIDTPPDMDGKSILTVLDTDKPANRFQVNRKPKVWRDSFLVERGKLLHQRVEGKEVSQEENFLPKHQRVKDLCQRAEYQTPCQQMGQKWQCVEDATGKLRLYKCKNEGGGLRDFQRSAAGRQRPISIKSQLYQRDSDACNCDLQPLELQPYMRPFNKKPFFFKKKFKALKSYSRNRFSRSVSTTNIFHGNRSQVNRPEESEDEFSGMGGVPNIVALPNSIKVTHRSLSVSSGLEGPQAAHRPRGNTDRDQQVDLGSGFSPFVTEIYRCSHQIETLQTKIKNLREIRGHLKKARPLECDCNKYLGSVLRLHQRQQQHILLINAVSSLDRVVLNQLHVQLMELRGCKGHKQCNPRTRSVELAGGREHGSFDDYR